MGNRRSAEKALEHVGARVQREQRSTSCCARWTAWCCPAWARSPLGWPRSRELGLDELLQRARWAGVPLLGLCLGMQLLFERSEEHDGAEGLGLLAGTVRRLNAPGLKLPHIGWSEVRWRRATPLSEGLPDPSYLYHVHSFAPVPAEDEVVLATAEYGEPFAAIVGPGNVFGTQSHPEKSSAHGLALLANFARMCAAHGAGGSCGRPRPRTPLRSGCGMILYPAIDILGGNAVRLVKGDFEAKKVYDEDPLSAARGWVQEGARVPARGRPRRRHDGRSGRTWSTCGGSRASWACRCSIGGGLRSR